LDIKDFRNGSMGKCIKTKHGYWSFIPSPLPPRLRYDLSMVNLLSEADRALGELAGVGRLLPNPHLLINPYIRREAVLSSRIEGTQASLSDLFIFEASPSEPTRGPDIQEVINYVKTLEYGLQRVKTLPLSLRLVREIHQELLTGVRGGYATPGEFRVTQNWIGPPGCTLDEAIFVPPAPTEMGDALGAWEKYLHSKPGEPPLLQCALMHYQFEAIHPFVDGNGRVGRLLITVFLCERGYLPQPLLYLSAYFEKQRDEYYRRLLMVSQRNDWRGWIEFYLRGVIEQSRDAIENAKKILDLQAKYRQALSVKSLPKATHAVLDDLFVNPFITIQRASQKWNMRYQTIQAAIERLVELGILQEVTQKRRHRMFRATELFNLISGETA
jgi:Fic family protein